MTFFEICPYVRFAEVIPGVMEGISFRKAPDCRLFFVLEGSGTLVLQTHTFSLAPGNIAYIPAGTSYNIEGDVKIAMLNFDLTASAFGTPPKSPMPADEFLADEIFDKAPPPEELEYPFYFENGIGYENKFQECVYLLASSLPSAQVIISGIVKTLLGKIKSDTAVTFKRESTAGKVMMYIRRNYDKELSCETIAGFFGYHPYYLNRIFKKEFGISVHQAVLLERLRIAEGLLKRTGLSVERIAQTVGFSERVSFYQAFRLKYGMSPTQYRDKCTANHSVAETPSQ